MSPEEEVLRSVARLLAAALPDGAPGSPDRWTVETVLEPGAVPARPWVHVEQIGQTLTAGSEARQQVTMAIAAQFFVATRERRHDTHAAAMDARDVVWRALKYGVGGDLERATPDRIPRWRYTPRIERHRVSVTGSSGTFVLSIDTGTETVLVDALPPTAAGSAVAEAIEAALVDAAFDLDPGDVGVFDRGAGMWDVFYMGKLAGLRVGDPAVDVSSLVAPSGITAAGSARVMLEGAAAPWRASNDFIRIAEGGLSISRPIPDRDDPREFSFAVDLRCTFVRGPVTASSYRVIQGITHGP